jgi:hypothetical protein
MLDIAAAFESSPQGAQPSQRQQQQQQQQQPQPMVQPVVKTREHQISVRARRARLSRELYPFYAWGLDRCLWGTDPAVDARGVRTPWGKPSSLSDLADHMTHRV